MWLALFYEISLAPISNKLKYVKQQRRRRQQKAHQTQKLGKKNITCYQEVIIESAPFCKLITSQGLEDVNRCHSSTSEGQPTGLEKDCNEKIIRSFPLLWVN